MKALKLSLPLILIGLGLLLSVASGVSLEENPSPSPTRTEQKQKAAYQTPTAQTLPTLSEQSLANQTNTADHKPADPPDQSSCSWFLDWLWQINLSNWAIVAAAIWAGCIARDSLKAIKRQADAAETALIQLERPWILIGTVIGGAIGEDPDGLLLFEVKFDISNTGKSPGSIYSRIAGFRLVENVNALPREPDYKSAKTAEGISVLGAGQQVHVPSTAIRLRQEDALAVREGQLTIMFLGQVLYRDFINPNIEHETLFCMFYSPPYHFRIDGGDREGGFYFAGPTEYNRCT